MYKSQMLMDDNGVAKKLNFQFIRNIYAKFQINLFRGDGLILSL